MTSTNFDAARETYKKIAANISKIMRGQADATRQLLAALAAGGHVLLEDFPGTGKTTLAKALAKSIDAQFKRLQFTPDLLPSDILGVSVFSQRDQQFHFHEGPVFTNILLADEINRASPRTQSALLEAMGEAQVSVEGERRNLSELFFVIATQNPVEFRGTYPLPEAQMDRFGMQFTLGYVLPAEEVAILTAQEHNHPLEELKPAATLTDVIAMKRAVENVRISDELKRYAVDLVAATRTASGVQLGASPRASISLMKTAQALALFAGFDFVTPEQIQKLAVAVIAHRLVLQPQARFSGVTARGVVEDAVKKLRVPGVTFFYKPIYWIYRATGGLWYWSRRRLTRAGLCVAGGCIVAGAVGLDVENTVTYQSFALLLALLLAAFACSFFFRAKFSATRSLPRFGTAGQALHYVVRVKNLGTKTQAGLTLLEELADPRPTFPEWLAFQMAESRRVRPFRVAQRRRKNPFRLATLKEAEMSPVSPNGEIEVRVEVLPLRRGILHFAKVIMARPDPLGLFRSFSRTALPQTVLILPRRYPLPPIALPGALRYQEGGVALAANVGRSEEFVALREYRHGDPLRHIHWRSWAKTGKPIVKEFEDEFFVRHALVLDTFDDEPNSEVLEEAVSVAASFACTILTQESLLDLLFIGNESYCFTAGRGLAHADQMLEILASVQNCADKKFETLEHLVVNHISAVSGCICVLQKWDDARKKFVEKLLALGVPLLVLVIVPPGGTKPDAGPLRDEPENFHALEIGRIKETLAKLK